MNTLKPNYKLKIGESGESNAFLIALRLGMDKRIIERAHKITYKENKLYLDYDKKIIDKDTLLNHDESIRMLGAVEKLRKISEKQKEQLRFKIGDCVYISTMNRTGIVCELENSKGDVVVMVMRKKLKVSHKRLTLYIEKEELYPENYDLDIAFETKENGKKKHLMNRKHITGTKIEISK